MSSPLFNNSTPSKKILLVGNPNCGKTTLFNALTGSTQRVGNWSGVTVEQKQGQIKTLETSMLLVDLPGTYSLLQCSADAALDERITADCIKQDNYDCVINVIDAANLERNLYLTCQLIEREVPLVVVINRIDLVRYDLDYDKLVACLGCPVLPVSATNRLGLERLVQTLEQPIPKVSRSIPYSKVVQDILNARPAELSVHECLSCLEGSIVERSPLYQGKILEWQQEILEKEGYDADVVIAQQRYAWIEKTLSKVAGRSHEDKKETTPLTEKLDKIVLHRMYGIPIFLGVMYALFFFAINIGGAFQDFFEISSDLVFVDGLLALCQSIGLNQTLTAIISAGIGKGISTVITFVPVIGAMFLALSFLEGSGYMARAAFVMDRLMRTLGLPGKSFVPLIVGFGCNVPAIMGSRTLEQRRDRVLTVMISPFMSCGARLAIFTLFVAAFFPSYGSGVVFLLYLIGIAMAVLTGILLKKTWLQGEPEPLILELPPYQWPKADNLWYYSWAKLKRFLLNAGRLIIPVCLVVGTLNAVSIDFKLKENSHQPTILAQVGKTVTPLFSPMGIKEDNWPATVGLFTGMMAKEVVIGTLNALYTQDHSEVGVVYDMAYFKEELKEALLSIPNNLLEQVSGFSNPVSSASPKNEVHDRIYGEMLSRFDGRVGAFAYLLFVLLYFPCISATAAMLKEVNKKWTLFSMGWTTLVAYASAVIFYQVANIEHHPLQSTSWLASITVIFGFVVILMRHYKPSKPVPTPIMVSSS